MQVEDIQSIVEMPRNGIGVRFVASCVSAVSLTSDSPIRGERRQSPRTMIYSILHIKGPPFIILNAVIFFIK